MKLVLIDSSAVFRIGMRLILTNIAGLELVGEGDDAKAARALVNAHMADVLVTDLQLSDGSALQLTRELCGAGSPARVLVIASASSRAVVHQAFAVGVAGYALKSQPAEELVDAVKGVLEGRRVIPPGWCEGERTSAGRLRARARAVAVDKLSLRETEVFEHVVGGYGNKEIAARLTISVKTVETHRARIYDKLGVHTGADMVRLASIWGLPVVAGGAEPMVA